MLVSMPWKSQKRSAGWYISQLSSAPARPGPQDVAPGVQAACALSSTTLPAASRISWDWTQSPLYGLVCAASLWTGEGEGLGGQVAGSGQHGQGDPQADESGQGHRHGRQYLLPDRAGKDAQRDREQRVTDRRHPLQVETQGIEPARPGLAHRVQPPGHSQPVAGRDGEGRAADERELDQRPVLAAHTLGPNQPVGAVFEFPGNQRCAAEQPREQRQEVERDGDQQTGLNSLLGCLTAPVQLSLLAGTSSPPPGERMQSGNPRSSKEWCIAGPVGIISAARTPRAIPVNNDCLRNSPPGQPDHAVTPHAV
jgi:hypothetical protein